MKLLICRVLYTLRIDHLDILEFKYPETWDLEIPETLGFRKMKIKELEKLETTEVEQLGTMEFKKCLKNADKPESQQEKLIFFHDKTV